MERERYGNAGRRAWWLVHVEAWRQSGLTQAAYCRKQGLERYAFVKWVKVLNEQETAKKLEEKRRCRAREPLSHAKRNRAVQAF